MGDADTAAPPRGGPAANDSHSLVIGIVEDLDLEPVARPVHRAHGVDDALGDITLVVDRDLDAYARLNSSPRQWGGGSKCRRGMSRLEAEGLHGQVEKVGAEDEEQNAGRRQHGGGERRDQVTSNNV